MPILIDLNAFLVTARSGSFSAAARELGTTPSVITKRVGRLEEEIGTPLFVRSTRRLSLTAEGERLRPRLQLLLAELAETVGGVRSAPGRLHGHLRVKSPTTVGTLFVGQSVARFLDAHPEVSIELLLMDRLLNPLEEGIDVALGALPQSFASVEEYPLAPYPRRLVAAPAYLEARGRPSSPSELASHDCLAFVPVGFSWSFTSGSGPIGVDVWARFTVNDSRLLLTAAEAGLGIAVLPEFLVRDALDHGRLESLLPEFPIEPYWFKAMVPRHKLGRPEVRALVEHLRREFAPPPWDA